jgi:hypothetical protein
MKERETKKKSSKKGVEKPGRVEKKKDEDYLLFPPSFKMKNRQFFVFCRHVIAPPFSLSLPTSLSLSQNDLKKKKTLPALIRDLRVVVHCNLPDV